MHRYRTTTCGALRDTDIGSTVRLAGWCHRIRDHGGVLFIDLRDHYGLTQVVADPDSPAFRTAETLRSEWVVRVEGRVRRRPDGTANPELPTGQVEVYIAEIEVLAPAAELPLPVFGEQEYPEEMRLKYRFLDLRREHLHSNIIRRGQIIDSIRRRMKEAGFFEFQTPILTASSPEGARDFLVPSRLHPGKFYALPQAPQQFKQLIMIAGFDRYFQIAPCFRDEDARADRSPGEFYQLDVEMSFVTQDDVFDAVEPVLRGVFEEFSQGKPVTPVFPRIPYAAALRSFGTDKPDLRNPLLMTNVTDVFRESGFKVFANQIKSDPAFEVWAIPAPGGGNRAFCDRMNSWAQGEGQPGLGYIFWREGEEEGAGPIARNLGPERTALVKKFVGSHPNEFAHVAVGLPGEFIRRYAELRPNGFEIGDAVFFVGGIPAKQYRFAGEARGKIGEELGLIDRDRFEFCWIVDFPMYEWSEEEKKIDFSHNPFSMPNYPIDDFLALDPKDHETILQIQAVQYDIVCNGVELSSGAIRNHRPDVMRKAFAIAGYDEAVLEQKFGGMLRALQYGAPPHGGIAPGIDRIVMLLCGEENLREVVLFPMNQRAEDLLMGAPSEVTAKQLRELHIRLNLPQTSVQSPQPLSKHLERIFLHEIVSQGEYALEAFKQFNAALSQHKTTEMFRYLETVLVHAARVSLLLWPSAERSASRGEHLRALLGVTNDNPLRTRSGRHHLQHFDERLDEWAASTKGNIYVDRNVGPPHLISIGGKPAEVLRHYNPQTHRFIFRSEEYDVQALATAVETLVDAARSKLG